MSRKAIIPAFFIILSCSFAGAQSISRSVTGINGKSVETGSYYLSFTTGEAAISTSFANFHFLTQGFQQPSLMNNLPGESTEPIDAIDAYPNPVSELLTISFRIVELKTYYVLIIDSMGRIVLNVKYASMTSRDEKIDMSAYFPGLYFVHVFSDNMKMNRVFKIDKI